MWNSARCGWDVKPLGARIRGELQARTRQDLAASGWHLRGWQLSWSGAGVSAAMTVSPSGHYAVGLASLSLHAYVWSHRLSALLSPPLAQARGFGGAGGLHIAVPGEPAQVRWLFGPGELPGPLWDDNHLAGDDLGVFWAAVRATALAVERVKDEKHFRDYALAQAQHKPHMAARFLRRACLLSILLDDADQAEDELLASEEAWRREQEAYGLWVPQTDRMRADEGFQHWSPERFRAWMNQALASESHQS